MLKVGRKYATQKRPETSRGAHTVCKPQAGFAKRLRRASNLQTVISQNVLSQTIPSREGSMNCSNPFSEVVAYPLRTSAMHVPYTPYYHTVQKGNEKWRRVATYLTIPTAPSARQEMMTLTCVVDCRLHTSSFPPSGPLLTACCSRTEHSHVHKDRSGEVFLKRT